LQRALGLNKIFDQRNGFAPIFLFRDFCGKLIAPFSQRVEPVLCGLKLAVERLRRGVGRLAEVGERQIGEFVFGLCAFGGVIQRGGESSGLKRHGAPEFL